MEETKMALDVNAIVDQLKESSILELSDLVKAIEEEFGVSAAAPVAAAAAGADAAAEKDSFTVELSEIGQEKVKVIKAVREITGLGLVEAKGVADNGGNIKENLPVEEAQKIKTQLEEAGATVELA